MVDKGCQNVVLYARHSSDKQWRLTGDQVRRCEAYCERSGYRVAQVFRDEDLSGDAVITRPGVRALIEAAFNGEFERVIIEDLSRVSRDQGDVAHLYKRLRFLDIELESITEGVINELHIGLKGTMNALFLKDLADKTHRGVIAAVLAGGIPGGEIYSYDVVRRQDAHGRPIRGLREVNEAQAAVVREIFRRCVGGDSLKNICEGLNARQIPSPRGRRWVPKVLSGQAVRQSGLLRQTLYKGVVTFNRLQFRKHPETGRRVSVMRPEREWILVPAPELAIMEDELFEAVQEQLAARSRRQRELKGKVLGEEEIAARRNAYEREQRAQQLAREQTHFPVVSGRLVCAEHGERMHTIRTRLYNCPVKGCPNRNLRLERDLMPLVWPALAAFDAGAVLGAGDEFEAEREALRERIITRSAELEREREEIGHVLDALGRKSQMTNVVHWLEGREAITGRIAHDLDEANEALRLIAEGTLGEAIEMTRAFKVELARGAARDEQGKRAITETLRLRRWIEAIRLSAVWDDGALPGPDGSRWKRSVEITYNARELLTSLRARKGRRWRSR